MGCGRSAFGGLTARPLVVTVAAVMIAACAGNGNGLDANGRPIAAGGDGGSAPLTADFDSLQSHIFTPICSVCHAGGGAPEGLRLDATNSYALLVGVPSTEVPSLMRVQPGDPDNSYIIQKLEGHAAVGAQMPFGGPYLSTATIAFIRQWITNGASPSTAATAAAASATGFTITAIVPAANEVVTAPPPQVMVAFSHELDRSRLNRDTLRLERLPSPDAPAAAEVIPVRHPTSAANPQVLMLWPTNPLEAGRYRLVIQPSGISDLSGRSATGLPLADPSSAAAVLATFDVEIAR